MNSPKSPHHNVQEGVTILSFGDVYQNIDEPAMDFLRKELPAVASQITPPYLVLDLTGVDFFGSSFIELLFVVSKRLTERQGRLALCGLSPHCAEVIHITHLDQLWKIEKTSDEAIAAIRD